MLLASLAAAAAMAIPPPHVFINVKSARLLDARTLELVFDHPRCEDPASLGTDVYGTGPQYHFGLLELRRDHGEPTCQGPVETQTLKVDLTRALGPGMVKGELQLNSETQYGYMKKLPMLTVRFDLSPPADAGAALPPPKRRR